MVEDIVTMVNLSISVLVAVVVVQTVLQAMMWTDFLFAGLLLTKTKKT